MPKSMREREGRDPLAERGRLVDIAEGMYEMPRGQCLEGIDCEKAGTHWLNVGCFGTELFSLPSRRVRFHECFDNSLVMNNKRLCETEPFVSECFKYAMVFDSKSAFHNKFVETLECQCACRECLNRAFVASTQTFLSRVSSTCL